MMQKQITILSIVILFLAGCTTPRQMTLFNGGEINTEILPLPEYVIETGDILYISFTAINAEAIAPYNSAGNIYTIKKDGTIDIPILGSINVVGKTQEALVEELIGMVREQVQKPIVRISISNAAITFLGEVNAPSRLSAGQPISMIEALGQVGGFTANAKCNNVLVMRRENGKIRSYHINMLTNEIYSSPCFYLQKGDVVYVAPLHAK